MASPTNVFSALSNAAAQASRTSQKTATGTEGADFSAMLKNAVSETFQAQKAAESLSVAAASGQNVPMHQVVEAISRAELTLQTMVSVRDKAVESYKEILSMPI